MSDRNIPKLKYLSMGRRVYLLMPNGDHAQIATCDVMGDGGRAAGAYQIWKIYVDDVNRIAGTKYTYSDRMDEQKSRQMVRIYLTHYGKGLSQIDMARIHNGGPTGHRKQSTLAYARKVMEALNEQKRSL